MKRYCFTSLSIQQFLLDNLHQIHDGKIVSVNLCDIQLHVHPPLTPTSTEQTLLMFCITSNINHSDD